MQALLDIMGKFITPSHNATIQQQIGTILGIIGIVSGLLVGLTDILHKVQAAFPAAQ